MADAPRVLTRSAMVSLTASSGSPEMLACPRPAETISGRDATEKRRPDLRRLHAGRALRVAVDVRVQPGGAGDWDRRCGLGSSGGFGAFIGAPAAEGFDPHDAAYATAPCVQGTSGAVASRVVVPLRSR
jgi:hypothetical protein